MLTYIFCGKLCTPDRILFNHYVIIEGRKVKSIERKKQNIKESDILIDAGEYWVTPGLMDIHIHGAYGYDTMDATPESISGISQQLVKHGVTSYLSTTMTATRMEIMQAIENVCDTPQPENGSNVLGLHIEGPYINPLYKGAHPEEQIRPPDSSEYLSWFEKGKIRLITLAPEIPGNVEVIEQCKNYGVKISVGHSNLNFEQALDAFNHGVSQATHTFNGMPPLHHRDPGLVGAILSDERIYAQVIADGVHVHPDVIKLLIKCKGVNRTILVSDATRAAGLKDGLYHTAGLQILVKDGVARTKLGGLAGSTSFLDKALSNIIQYTDLPFQYAIKMATSVPAKSLGISNHKGVISPGVDADIAIFDRDLKVKATMVAGNMVYNDM